MLISYLNNPALKTPSNLPYFPLIFQQLYRNQHPGQPPSPHQQNGAGSLSSSSTSNTVAVASTGAHNLALLQQQHTQQQFLAQQQLAGKNINN